MSMKNILIILSSIILLLSCNSNSSKNVVLLDLPENANYIKGNIKNSEVEILNPNGMTVCDDYLVVFDNVQERIFKVYKLPELNYLYSWGTKGRGPEEFVNIDDSSIREYNNHLELMDNQQIKVFKILDDKMVMIEKKEVPILDSPINRIQRISDSIYFADNLMTDPSYEHVIFDLKSKEMINKFGDYPTTISTSSPTESYLTYSKWVASNPDLGIFMTFYYHLGLIKIYNRDGQLEKEIIVNDPEIQKVSTNPNIENKMYFALPYASKNYVTIMRLNKTDSELGNDIESFKPEFLFWNWDGELIGRCSLDIPMTRYAISEKHKTLYGIFPLKEKEIYHFDLSSLVQNIQ